MESSKENSYTEVLNCRGNSLGDAIINKVLSDRFRIHTKIYSGEEYQSGRIF